MSAMSQSLRDRVTKDFGKRCKEFNYHCVVCQVHLAADLLEDAYGAGEEQDE